MTVFSLIRQGYQLTEVEVEVGLHKGVPAIEILGQPDSVLKESKVRIWAAFRALGIAMPKAKKIIVNLKPMHVRKRSCGLEFAIAAAILWKLQIFEAPQEPVLLYGELGLDGSVKAPEDICDYLDGSKTLWTGKIDRPERLSRTVSMVSDLSQLISPMEIVPAEVQLCKEPPGDMDDFSFAPELAKLLKIVSVGQHPLMLAGPQGVGKTTLAKAVHRLLPPVDNSTFRQTLSIHRMDGRTLHQRPFVAPHHTSSRVAVIGGGSVARPGDFSRSHGGVLLLDEFLQFHPQVQEALREPMESGSIQVSRSWRSERYPAQALVLATTNLCPCGRWVPGRRLQCSMSLRRCRSHLEKLSGPALDRFAIMYFLKKAFFKGDRVSLKKIRDEVNQCCQWRGDRKPAAQLEEAELMADLEPQMRLDNVQTPSRRRRLHWLRVGRTVADLDRSAQIERKHMRIAHELSILPFQELFAEME